MHQQKHCISHRRRALIIMYIMCLILIRYFTLGFALREIKIILSLFRLMMSFGVTHMKKVIAAPRRCSPRHSPPTHDVDDDGDDDDDDNDVRRGMRVIARSEHAHATARTRARVVDSQRPR